MSLGIEINDALQRQGDGRLAQHGLCGSRGNIISQADLRETGQALDQSAIALDPALGLVGRTDKDRGQLVTGRHIHLGAHKTASTHIQAVLRENGQRLAAAGVR